MPEVVGYFWEDFEETTCRRCGDSRLRGAYVPTNAKRGH